jgi:hypothetical protein
VAAYMARIAEVLIESNVKWTAVSNGREQDVAGGLTVRFVPRRDATEPAPDEALMYVEHLPEDPAAIALHLFNAREVTESVRMSRLPPPPVPAFAPIRANGAPESAKTNGTTHTGALGHGSVEERARPWAKPEPEPIADAEDPAIMTQGLGIVGVIEKSDAAEPLAAATDWATEFKKNERKQRKQTATALVATALFILLFGGLAVVWVVSAPTPHEEATDSSATVMRSAAAAPLPPQTNQVNAVPSASAAMTNAPSGTAVTIPTAIIKPTSTGKTKKNAPKKDGQKDPWDF